MMSTTASEQTGTFACHLTLRGLATPSLAGHISKGRLSKECHGVSQVCRFDIFFDSSLAEEDFQEGAKKFDAGGRVNPILMPMVAGALKQAATR